MNAMPLPSWQQVLAQTRESNRASRGTYDLRLLYRAQAFTDAAGVPETLVRAQAFAHVLARIPLHRYAGEEITGSIAGFYAGQLPDGVTDEDYRRAEALCAARGQRDFVTGWDHSLPDYPTLLREGIGGVITRIDASLDVHDDAQARATLRGMRGCLEGVAQFALRYAAVSAADMSERLRRVAYDPPRTFHEALQLIWLMHIALRSEERYHMALGRIDQYLRHLYARDVAQGLLDDDGALNLLCHLWVKIEELGEVTNICIGGLTPEGGDATNALSYLCLQATRLVQSPHTNLSARFHDQTPEAFHRACFACIRTGVGFPAIFNDHVLLQGLAEIAIPDEVARDYCMVGCIETMLAGRQPAWSDCFFNTPLCLTEALRRMRCEPHRSYARLMELFAEVFHTALRDFITERTRLATARTPEQFPDPLLSALTQDCITRARDINDGGALYPRFIGIAMMGLATLADSLAAVKD